MLFTAYATIVSFDTTDPLAVVVQGSVCNNGMPFTTSARLVYPTTSQVQVVFKPVVGDKVLLIGLQSYSDNMFESSVTLTENEVNNVQHYTILGCVAVPLNIESAKAKIEVSYGKIKVGNENKEGVVLNKGDDPVVRWSELKEILQELWKAYNFHGHSSEGAGPPSKYWLVSGGDTPSPSGAPDFTDLASEHLAVPKHTGA